MNQVLYTCIDRAKCTCTESVNDNNRKTDQMEHS